jgi:hypothetical protein
MKTTVALLVTALAAFTLADISNYDSLIYDQGSCYIATGTAITGHRFSNGTEVRNSPVNATLAVNLFDKLFILDLAQYGKRIANETHAYLKVPVLGGNWVPIPTNYDGYVSDASDLLSRGLRVALTNNFQGTYNIAADYYNYYHSLIRSKFDCNTPVAMAIGQTPLTAVVANGGYNVYYYTERVFVGGPSGAGKEIRSLLTNSNCL